MENKRKTLKNILLFLSILPYIIFLILGIINLIKIFIEYNQLCWTAIIGPIENFWFESIVRFDILKILPTMFCAGYPVYYILDKRQKGTVKNWLFIAFIISFIPYLLAIYSAIFGINFGILNSGSTYYGYKAIILVFCLCSITPIYPAILIFQIIYIIIKYRVFSDFQKKLVKLLVVVILLLLIIPSIAHHVYAENNLKTTYQQDKIIIENYLEKEFQDFYKEMEIVQPTEISSNYRINTPLLKHSFEVFLNDSRSEVEGNTFYNEFIEQYDMNSRLNDYLNQSLNLPSYLRIQSRVDSFDLNKYNGEIDELLNSCKYKIDSFYIIKEYYNKDEIIENIKDYYNKYNDKLKRYYVHGYINFFVNVNNELYASIQLIESKHQPNVLYLNFNGYTNNEYTTIPNENIEIVIR